MVKPKFNEGNSSEGVSEAGDGLAEGLGLGLVVVSVEAVAGSSSGVAGGASAGSNLIIRELR